MTTSGKPSTISCPLRGFSIDKQYYIPSGDLHFRVERTIFRVHSYFFARECPQFRERMAGVDCAKVYDGRSDQTAIPVRGTSVAELSHFLWVFYNPNHKHSAPAAVWRTILTLASPARWDFPKVLALALAQLHDLDLPVLDRIALYQGCSIPFEHIIPLYGELCAREEPLTLEESVRLGWELTVAISQVREHLLRRGNGSGDDILGTNGTITQDQVHELIKSMLNINERQSSIMSLCDLHRCSTPRRDARDQAQLDQTKYTEGQANSPQTQATDISDACESSPKSAVNAVKQARNFARSVVGGLKKSKSGANA